MQSSGDQPVCLFAAYDPQGRIHPHVAFYLDALRRAGFRVVVGHAGPLERDAPAVARLLAAGLTFVERPNTGLDFGTWRHLIGEGHVGAASHILLANDSVYGPLSDLTPIVRRMTGSGLDVWGMVESLERGRHLQSWFVHFTASMFWHPVVQRVFDQPFDDMTKREIVVRGELALGAALEDTCPRWGAVWQAADRRYLARLLPFNPMLLNWEEAVRRGGVPFIKVQLLRENPFALPWVRRWPDVVRRFPDFPLDVIQVHLDAIARPAGRERDPAVHSIRRLVLFWLLSRDRYATRDSVPALMRLLLDR
ncbi:MAG TPA: rhamnan synthesis F family protein [Acetobacteraceae bacterium]|jgi:lipopolysaccharide biosynthesis protein